MDRVLHASIRVSFSFQVKDDSYFHVPSKNPFNNLQFTEAVSS